MSDVEFGSGSVPIFPTFQGFRVKTTAEVDSVGRDSGNRFSNAFKTVLGGGAALVAGLGLGRVGAAVTDYFRSGIVDASALEQSVGAVDAIFKGNASQIHAWAGSAATDVGLTKNEFNELGSLIGAQLKNGGTAMEELAPKTNDLIRLGADLSSMFGGQTSEAVEALSSALKGERDPIERYGVSLNQAKIDAEAAALGFEKVGGTLSSEANQAATLSLIMKQTADAHGNFASEADTLAGKQQRLNAIWENGKTTLASKFLPAISDVTGMLVDKLPAGIDTAGAAIDELIGGVRAFGVSFRIADGDVTSSGFPGFMERAGYQAALLAQKGRDLWQGLTVPAPVTASIRTLEDATPLSNALQIGRNLRPILLSVRDAAVELWSGFTMPADTFSSITALENDGPLPRLVSIGQRAREVFDAAGPAVSTFFGAIGTGLATGNFGPFADTFDAFLAIARPAAPIIVSVGSSLGDMSGQIGQLVGSALPLLGPLLKGAATVMQFLADNTGLLTAAIVAVTGVILIAKAAQVAKNIADALAVPSAFALAASNFALAGAKRAETAATTGQIVAERQSIASRALSATAALRSAAAAGVSRVAQLASAAATRVAAGAQALWTAATNGSALASARSAAAVVLSRGAQIAGAAATGIATAAQWAWNAAMAANPIGIIIVAIAALVAALVFFFTQTDLGREIWANFMQFLQEAWANIVAVAQVVWQAISTAVQVAWSLIVLYVQTYIAVVQAIIGAVLGFITTVWNAAWNGISAVISFVWALIVAYVTTYINVVLAIVTAVVGFVVAVWQAAWDTVSAVVQAVWAFIVGFVTAYINLVLAVVSAVISTVQAVWSAGWNAVSAVVQAVWAFVVSTIQSAVNIVSSVVSTLVSIFTDAWNGAANAVRAGVDVVLGFFRDVPSNIMSALGDVGSLLFSSGQAIVQGFIDGISGMIGAVGDAVGGVLDFAAGFFPNSPAKRGPFSGAGWRRIGRAGRAVVREFSAGVASTPVTGLDQQLSAAAAMPAAAAASLRVETALTSSGAVARIDAGGDMITLVEVTNKTGVRLEDLVDIRVRKVSAADARRAEQLGRRR